MNQLFNRSLLAALVAALALAGCHGQRQTRKKTPTVGERIPVLNYETRAEAAPELADIPVVLPTPAVNAEWPQPGGSASKSNGHLQVNDTLARAWSVSIGKGSTATRRLNASPIVYGGRVYTMDTAAGVRAFDAATGREIWQARIAPPPAGKKKRTDDAGFGGGVSAGDGRIYATSGYGIAAAFDAKTGAQIWKQSFPTPLRGAPTVAGNRVYMLTNDNQLIALTAETGEQAWTVNGTVEVAGLLGTGAPAVALDTVVAGFSSGELNALRAENGRTVWSDALARTGRSTAMAALADIDASPVIDRGRVFAIGHGGRMAALELATGQRVWERNFAGTQTPWVAGDFIYAVTLEGEVVCITRGEGKIRWVLQLQRYLKPKKKEDPVVWAGPVLASDRLLIAGSSKELISVSPYTGKELSRVKIGAPAYLAPVVANKTVYLLTDDGKLSAWR